MGAFNVDYDLWCVWLKSISEQSQAMICDKNLQSFE